MTIEVDKGSLIPSLQTSRADTQRALASLTAALTPELDAEICVERAVAAHQELTEAIAKLEQALPKSLLGKGSSPTRPDSQTPIEVAILSPDCPARVRNILEAILHISKGGGSYGGYYRVAPLIRDEPPMQVLADFARFSRSNFQGIRQVGKGTIDELVAFLAKKGVTLKSAES